MYKPFLSLFILLVYPILLFAQSSVSCRVKDKNNNAIPGATINLLQADSSIIISTFSDKNGFERLAAFCLNVPLLFFYYSKGITVCCCNPSWSIGCADYSFLTAESHYFPLPYCNARIKLYKLQKMTIDPVAKNITFLGNLPASLAAKGAARTPPMTSPEMIVQ